MSFNNLDNHHFNGKEKKFDWMHFEIAKYTTRLKNAKILHDYDHTNFMAGTATAGYETKVNETMQFFSRTTA